ncbi:hypothetical protein, partial [Salmonella sp. SAL4450]|uniref:hypothetical protein n=1 Tax=Salmonella sp. SAL4450 TaxID=3159905 RepID=UPI00397E2A77
ADGGGIVGGSVFVMAADGTNVRLVYRTDVIAVPSSWAGHVMGPLATPVPELTPAMVAPGPGLATDEASSSNTSGGPA